MLRNRRLLAFLAPAGMLGLCLLGPGSAQATTMLAMSLQELTDEAELVAMVEGVHSDPFWSGPKVLTQVRVKVVELWKGPHLPPGELIDVLTLGGEVGATTQVVPGAAKLPLGRTMVLFLRSAASHTGEYHVLGLGQGAWHLADTSPALGPSTRISQSDVDHLVGGPRADGGGAYTLGQLREAVRGRADGPQ